MGGRVLEHKSHESETAIHSSSFFFCIVLFLAESTKKFPEEAKIRKQKKINREPRPKHKEHKEHKKQIVYLQPRAGITIPGILPMQGDSGEEVGGGGER